MPIGYGYQSSDAASYVNWAAVTKGFTDVIDADIADREKRKAEYEKQDRELSQTLANQPLGQFEDGNTFTNNFVDAMTNQRLIDYKLFKAGRLKEKDYRLKTNNAIDGTNTIFDLQKKYQEAAADRMKGLQDGTYQPLTSSNMALIEGFKDFKDSVPIVDPKTGIINIAKKKYNEKTKTWDIDYGKTMPVNMAMNLISTPAAAYKIDPIIDNAVASMGTLKDALYQAASKNGAGTITELTGPEGFKKYPGAAGVITNFNDAINGKVEEYLTDPLHMTSVLTMNVGGYSAESFTYDKAEAAKDPSKILMKIDPSSKYPTMDQSGPNYKKQKEEAASWIKTQFMSRIDRERKIQTTSQLSDQTHYPAEWETAWAKDKDKTAQTGEMLAALYGGNDQQVSTAKSFFLGLDNVKDVERDATGTTIYYKDGTKKKLDFTANKVGIGVDNFVDAGTKALLGNDVSLSDARRGITKYKGRPLNTKQVFAKPVVTSSFTPAVQKRVADNQGKIIKDDNTSDNINRLTAAYGDLGFRFTRPEGNPKGMVTIVSPTGKIKQTVNVFGDNPENAINQFIINQQNDEFSRKAFAPTENVNAAAIEGGGVGSQY
jgi:hypothetical protein